MSVAIEIYYAPPVDVSRESVLTEVVESRGGQLDFREESSVQGLESVVLTYEFLDWGQAAAAAEELRARGEHVEGPMEYGE